ncbi:HutD/Ves family protein [Tabrizicola oligotrophica]|uniref:HutD family protein n=1 Tax=Tabrizicola oligotrophica TaxID=2710650 RepID=A0A6M0QU51_9RHOB|nr:HutD family protein [Tabrizicola oligotrophica]NEY90173.1 HutD family protein [Tabrizicola oligotrophica]
MRHLTPADYTVMPWANGKGTTIEMLKTLDGGQLKWRLSRASVVENGDFSIFPGVERNLTVLTGPGFDLVGQGLHLPARPLVPVAFAGDLPIRAEGVSAPSDDFNVMTDRALPRPEVAVVTGAAQVPAGGLLAVYALAPSRVNGRDMAAQDLLLTDDALSIAGQVIVVRLLD